ncbi:hypothetical protein K9M47_03130 [Candidatus Gracilibacteria bacterium]|nr:hypothetical protein [Candidatus Gracilibacteria bacterium]
MENLNELEITKIEQFCADKEMYNAVKKIILASVYTHGTVQKGFIPNPLQNGAFSLASLATNNPIPDNVLGEHIRGMWAGVNALENGFNELSKITSGKEIIESPYNEAV